MDLSPSSTPSPPSRYCNIHDPTGWQWVGLAGWDHVKLPPHMFFLHLYSLQKKKKVGYLGIELAITRCDYENQRARNEIILSNIASWLTILIVNEGSNNWGVRAAMYMNIHVVHFHLVYIFWNFDILHLEPSFLFYLTKRFKNSFCFIFDITLSNILKNSYITVVMNWTLSK